MQPDGLIRSRRVPGYNRGYRVADKSGTSGGVSYVAPYEYRSGVRNPKWEAQVRSKVDASTDYTLRKDPSPVKGISVSPVKWTWYTYEWIVNRYDWWVTTVDGYPHWDSLSPMFTTTGAYGPEISKLVSISKLAFLAKLKEAQQSWSAPTFLGELSETVKMLKRPLQGFTKATVRYRKRMARLTSARNKILTRGGRIAILGKLERQILAERLNRLQSSAEKAFLQWTFGVAPLIGDVKAMLETMDRLASPDQAVVVKLSVTVARDLEKKSFVTRDVVSGNRVVLTKTITETAKAKVRFRGAVKVLLHPPDSVDRLKQLAGVDLRELVPTLYELTPFSWAADYVSTLGSVVNGAFVSTRNLVYATQSTQLRAERKNICVPSHGTWGAGFVLPNIPAEGLTDFVSHNRSKANLNVGFSDLRFTIPTVRQIVNMAAVASQLIRAKLGDK